MGLNLLNLGKKAITAIFAWDFGPNGSAWKNSGVDPRVSMRRVAAKRGGESPHLKKPSIEQKAAGPTTNTLTEEKEITLVS